MDANTLFVPASVLDRFAEVVAGQSTRHGGVSPAPFASLNLGWYTPDEADRVAENRNRFFSSIGMSPKHVAGARQVHGNTVIQAASAGEYKGVDGLVSNVRGLILAIAIADCCPVLLYDPVREAVAAIHAGWRGTVAGITREGVARMEQAFGSKPEDLMAFVGTCIDRSSYEVDADVADHFAQTHKLWDQDRKKFYIDLKKANRDQLLAAGIPGDQIGLSPWCTYRNNDQFFSHRKEHGQTGRGLAVIALRP